MGSSKENEVTIVTGRPDPTKGSVGCGQAATSPALWVLVRRRRLLSVVALRFGANGRIGHASLRRRRSFRGTDNRNHGVRSFSDAGTTERPVKDWTQIEVLDGKAVRLQPWGL